MPIKTLYNATKKLGCDVLLNEPLFKHSSFKIGGPADIFIKPYNILQLKEIIKNCNNLQIPYNVIGNGTNIIFKDNGFKGAIINISSKMEDIQIENDYEITASAGTTLAKLAYFAMEHSLTGLEFCWGIPGNVGGAVFMNAGAYNREIKDVIINSYYIDNNCNEGFLTKNEMQLGYRYSIYFDNKFIITSAKFKLTPATKQDIKLKMDEFMAKRKLKQPLEFPNAGSIFKRPKGNYAGTLIEQCGLKGFSVGGAEVSKKHAGFIINKGTATAEDVIKLISIIKKTVFEKTGYNLEPEIKII